MIICLFCKVFPIFRKTFLSAISIISIKSKRLNTFEKALYIISLAATSLLGALYPKWSVSQHVLNNLQVQTNYDE